MKAPIPRLTLQAATAADLMSPNPVSLREDAGVQDAIVMLTDRGYAAAPVIDERGRPVGVISVTDLLIHNREFVDFLKTADETVPADVRHHRGLADYSGVEVEGGVTVFDIMTPAVFTIRETALASEVVATMIRLQVHHLFVADEDGVLIGVISTRDILKKLM